MIKPQETGPLIDPDQVSDTSRCHATNEVQEEVQESGAMPKEKIDAKGVQLQWMQP